MRFKYIDTTYFNPDSLFANSIKNCKEENLAIDMIAEQYCSNPEQTLYAVGIENIEISLKMYLNSSLNFILVVNYNI